MPSVKMCLLYRNWKGIKIFYQFLMSDSIFFAWSNCIISKKGGRIISISIIDNRIATENDEGEMAGIAEIYIDEIRKQNKDFYATWIPGKPMKLGDMGIIEKNQFTLVGNLKDQGVKFKVRRDPSPMPYQFNSKDGVKVVFKPGGKVDPKFSDILKAEVGFGVEFGKKGKFFFKASKLYEDCIDDLITLGRDVQKIFQGKVEDKDYVVIDRLIKSPCVTILISKEANSKVSLIAKTDISLKTVNIADASIELSVKSSSGLAFDCPNMINATPFFGVRSVRKLSKIAADFRPVTIKPKMKSLTKGKVYTDSNAEMPFLGQDVRLLLEKTIVRPTALNEYK